LAGRFFDTSALVKLYHPEDGTPEVDRIVNAAGNVVSRSGVVAWRPGRAAANQVTIFDRRGQVIGTAGPPGGIQSISLAPGEARLLASGSSFVVVLPDVRVVDRSLAANVENANGNLADPVAGKLLAMWTSDTTFVRTSCSG
jgi:hypothetical protein